MTMAPGGGGGPVPGITGGIPSWAVFTQVRPCGGPHGLTRIAYYPTKAWEDLKDKWREGSPRPLRCVVTVSVLLLFHLVSVALH
jgi:hypothetical protein